METAQMHKDNSAALANVFTTILSDLKNNNGIWDDLVAKSGKLHHALRFVLQASTAFLETFQRVADMATAAQGATKEIGVSLTRLCMRQRTLDNKLKALSHHLQVSLANPIQERQEEWKRRAVQLDKDRVADMKKAKADWKKVTQDWTKIDKKVRKARKDSGVVGAGGGIATSSLAHQEELLRAEMEEKRHQMDCVERECVRKAMLEERSRFCQLLSCLKPVLDCQVSMLSEFVTMEELNTTFSQLCAHPGALPAESEAFLADLLPTSSFSSTNTPGNGETVTSTKLGSNFYQQGVGSTNGHGHTSDTGSGGSASLGSRKSSMASISSVTSNSSAGSSQSPGHNQLNQIKDHMRSREEAHQRSQRQRSNSQHHRNSSSSVSCIPGAGLLNGSRRRSTTPGREEARTLENRRNKNRSMSKSEPNQNDDDGDTTEDEVVTPSSANSSTWLGEGEGGEKEGESGPGEDGRGRHTISSAYERAGQSTRPSLNAITFDPLNGRSNSIDNGPNATLLYPNQSLPAPGYTNLPHLATVAKTKYSIGSQRPPPIQHHPSLQHSTPPQLQHQVSSPGSLPSHPSANTTPLRRMTLPNVPTAESMGIVENNGHQFDGGERLMPDLTELDALLAAAEGDGAMTSSVSSAHSVTPTAHRGLEGSGCVPPFLMGSKPRTTLATDIHMGHRRTNSGTLAMSHSCAQTSVMATSASCVGGCHSSPHRRVSVTNGNFANSAAMQGMHGHCGQMMYQHSTNDDDLDPPLPPPPPPLSINSSGEYASGISYSGGPPVTGSIDIGGFYLPEPPPPIISHHK